TLAVWHRDYRGVEIWDPIKRTLRGTLPIFEAGWRSAGRFELSEDGRLLAYLHTGGDIDIWDVDSATKKTTLKTGHKLSHNTPAAFSPGGRTLAVAALSGDVSQLDLWDVPSGTRRATSAGEPSGVILFPLSERTRILFSRDGRTVVSASDQGVVD